MEPVINPDIQISLGDMLAATPVHNEAVINKYSDEEQMVLRVPMRKRWYMSAPFSWIFPFRNHRNFALDSLGREVWEACDGKRNVEQIIDAFANRHSMSFHEARIGVMEFLKNMTKRGLVVILGTAQKGDAG
jgi:hypothetical protein